MRYYATLGYTPGVLLDLRDFVSPRPHVTIFHGDLNPKQKEANEKALVLLREMDIKHEFVEVPAPWNLEDCLGAILAAWHKHGKPSDVVVNASGGTEVLNAAATMFCLFARCEGRYWDRRRAWPKTVHFDPMLRALALRGTKQALISKLAGNHGRLTLQEVQRVLKVSPAAVTKMIQELEAENLVTVQPVEDGRGKAVLLSPQLWPFMIVEDPAFRRTERAHFTADVALPTSKA